MCRGLDGVGGDDDNDESNPFPNYVEFSSMNSQLSCWSVLLTVENALEWSLNNASSSCCIHDNC